jgi:hypothetical protein
LHPDSCFEAADLPCRGKIVPVFKGEYVPRSGFNHYSGTIFFKQKTLVKWPIEQKDELMFRIFLGESAKNFLHIPSIALKLIFL